MSILNNIVFIYKVQNCIKKVKAAIKNAETEAIHNNITGGINKIAEGLNDIKKEVPEIGGVIDKILKALRDE